MIHENVQQSKQLFCNYSDEYEIGRLSVHVNKKCGVLFIFKVI